MLKFTRSSDIRRFVKAMLEARADLEGRIVIDIPAGEGHMSAVLRDCGARVRPYDLFPAFFEAEGLVCQRADLTQRLPIDDAAADLVLCQEGIEHMPDQLAVLRELNRILKRNGTLVLTTPNISHLRAKMSNLFTESELYKRMPPNELDALWFSEGGDMYFGHIFLIGIQRLRVLAKAAGFRIARIHPVKASMSSVGLGALYPFIVLVNLLVYWRNVYRDDGIARADKKRVYREIVALNVHPTILFGRHLFLELEKEREWAEVDLRIERSAPRAEPGRPALGGRARA